MIRPLFPALVLCLSASAASAQSAAPAPEPEPAPAPAQESVTTLLSSRNFRLGIEYRLWMTGLSPYALDSQATLLDQSAFSEHRLRVSPVWTISPRLRLKGQADLVTGILAGDTTEQLSAAADPRNARGGLNSARGRELFAEYRFLGTPEKPGGALRAGLQTNTFGLGLVANDGKNDEQDFGLKRFGDEQFRVLLGSRPVAIATKGERGVPWQLILAGDLVRRDSLASFEDGDRALQGIVALEYLTKPLEVGIYTAIRRQTAPLDPGDLDAETLNVQIADLFFRWEGTYGAYTVSLAGEGALATGETTLTRSEALPNGTDILQGGGVLRAGARRGPLGLELEAGYASGDPNPKDGTTTNFTFNRDYNVSLLMFEQVLGDLSARDATRALNPETTGVPPDGAELLPTDGGVSGASYAKLTARYQPNQALKLIGAVVYGRASSDVVASFASFENGGLFANYLGGDPSRRSLGWEGDLALRYRIVPNRIPLEVSLQSGAFLPGSALTDEAGLRMDPVYTLQAGLILPLLDF